MDTKTTYEQMSPAQQAKINFLLRRLEWMLLERQIAKCALLRKQI